MILDSCMLLCLSRFDHRPHTQELLFIVAWVILPGYLTASVAIGILNVSGGARVWVEQVLGC